MSNKQNGRPVGHIREISPGKWKVQTLRGYDENGKPKYKHSTMPGTREQAEWELRRLEREVGRTQGGKARNLSNLTVEAALEEWRDAHESGWTVNQQATAKSTAKKLEPIHYKRVEDLTRADVEHLRDQLLALKLSSSYVKRVIGSLSTCLTWLVARGDIPVNVAQGIKVSTTKRPCANPWDVSPLVSVG